MLARFEPRVQWRLLTLLIFVSSAWGLVSPDYPATAFCHRRESRGHRSFARHDDILTHQVSARSSRTSSICVTLSNDNDVQQQSPDNELDLDDEIGDLEGNSDDDHDIEDENISQMASPLSQLPPDEYAKEASMPYIGRTEKWLETATDEFLDQEALPLGSLTEEDVEAISGLMAAWVRRRSLHAALVVERLLKRVIDDMRAGNRNVAVDARMYTIAIDAWAKSGVAGAAQRAQTIHDGMVQMYKETDDQTIRPSTISYNTLVNSHCKSMDSGAMNSAERVLQEMLDSDIEGNQPDAITFSTLIDGYGKWRDQNATQRAEELFEIMDEVQVKRNVFTFSALQNVYARSGRPDAPEKTEEVLYRMLELYNNGDVFAKPNCVNYNAVLNAFARTPNMKSAEKAIEFIERMERPVSEGGFEIDPDRMSYALVILACTRCSDEAYGVNKAEKILEKLELRALEAAKRREEVSSAAPPSVRLDAESFNVVLTALSKSRMGNAVERSLAIIRRMEKYADENGQVDVRPTTRSWNAVLNSLARSRAKGSAKQAEDLLYHMFELHRRGVLKSKPDEFSFAAVLTAYQKSDEPGGVERADDILRRMEEMYEKGELDAPPDVYHYTIVCAAWAKSGETIAPQRVQQILGHMMELNAKGHDVKPNVRTYNAVLDCLSRADAINDAEQLLYHMISLHEKGENYAIDHFSFNSVIYGFCRSKVRDAGRRAEAVLEQFLEINEQDPRVQPDLKSFTRIIDYYKRCRQPDAPYRAEYILNRMIALFKAGKTHLEPDNFAFKAVMDAYALSRHPDAAPVCERLLKQMRELKEKFGAKNLEVDSSTMYSILFAWSVSGYDDAGRRAEMHLDDMERKYLAGNKAIKPNERNYGLVLNAWSKSTSFDKAERALGVLKRMEKIDIEDVKPNEHTYSLVINACAFTNSGPAEEAQAFRIAVSTFDKMLKSKALEPSSLTYGWFIQACGRLRVDAKLKNEQIERGWITCCDRGLVNGFVLHRFTGAAPEKLYKKLMAPVLQNIPGGSRMAKEELKFKISPSDLPSDWTRNSKEKVANAGWWENKS